MRRQGIVGRVVAVVGSLLVAAQAAQGQDDCSLCLQQVATNSIAAKCFLENAANWSAMPGDIVLVDMGSCIPIQEGGRGVVMAMPNGDLVPAPDVAFAVTRKNFECLTAFLTTPSVTLDPMLQVDLTPCATIGTASAVKNGG